MSIKIIYNSPAMPQDDYNFTLNKVYECKKVKDKYVIEGANFNNEFTPKFIKSIFKPCKGYSWEMLEEKDKIKQVKQINNTKKIK